MLNIIVSTWECVEVIWKNFDQIISYQLNIHQKLHCTDDSFFSDYINDACHTGYYTRSKSKRKCDLNSLTPRWAAHWVVSPLVLCSTRGVVEASRPCLASSSVPPASSPCDGHWWPVCCPCDLCLVLLLLSENKAFIRNVLCSSFLQGFVWLLHFLRMALVAEIFDFNEVQRISFSWGVLSFLYQRSLCQEFLLWHSGLRIQLHLGCCIRAGSIPGRCSGLEYPALLYLWCRVQLWLRFRPWPRNFHVPRVQP